MEEGYRYSNVVVRIADHTTGLTGDHLSGIYGRECGRIFPEQRVMCQLPRHFASRAVGEMAVHRDEESHSVFASTASYSDPPDFSSHLCSTPSLDRIQNAPPRNLGTYQPTQAARLPSVRMQDIVKFRQGYAGAKVGTRIDGLRMTRAQK